MNNSGKTLTIFLSVISVLFLSITAIAVFLLMEEAELRETTEYELEQTRITEAKLQTDFKASQKKVFLLEEKIKEADERSESLMEDLELEQGLREEVKKENRELREARDALEKENQAADAAQQKLKGNLTKAQQKNSSLKAQVDAALRQNRGLEQQYQELQQKTASLETSLSISRTEEVAALTDSREMDDDSVELERIVINLFGEKKGAIISVDRETNFIIVGLGKEDGVKENAVLSIYRSNRHLGDVRVSRVLSGMSAADFIPPLESRDVRKDDQAVIKVSKK